MKHFTQLFVATLLSIFITSAVAQETKDAKSEKKDNQNQDQFFKSDKESKLYNYYERKKISQPLQPSYDTDSMPFQKGNKKKEEQQKAFLNNQYRFPAKPKDKWEIGLNFGLAFLSGDVKAYLQRPDQNFGVGLNVRKSLGYALSLRMGYNFFLTTGRNYERDQNLKFNKPLNPSPGTNGLGATPAFLDLNGPNYYDNPRLTAANTKLGKDLNRMFVYNYRFLAHQVNLDLMFNLGNVLFHRERTKWGLYAFIGGSGLFFQTKYDALDKNGQVYDFSEVNDIWENGKSSPYNNDKDIKKAVYKQLKTQLDGNYETLADRDKNAVGIKSWTIIPAFNVGAGVSFRPLKFMSISLEQRLSITANDNLDGYRWAQDEYTGYTVSNDMLSYTSLNFGFHVGAKTRTEPLYWLNPMDYTYKKLSDVNPDKLAEDLNKDTDEDGVPDRLDKEPDTKKGSPVDVKGVALDSDKDGIADSEDKEPYSPPGFPIDQYGVAQVPPPACCAEMAKGGGGGGAGRGGYDCTKMELPSIYFEDDAYYLDPNNEGTLHTIAERLQMCPDVRLVISGKDESKNDRKYNEQLAYNRSSSVVDYMVERYGMSRDRFIVKYDGGAKANNATSLQKKKSRRVEFRYANDGEQGESNPPAPHPGLKAGTNK
jgi:OOP family OmpA-OmpF porin